MPFKIEMKYNARRLGFRIVEVPITFVDREFGTSKMSMNIFREAFLGCFANAVPTHSTQPQRQKRKPHARSHRPVFIRASIVNEGKVQVDDVLIAR